MSVRLVALITRASIFLAWLEPTGMTSCSCRTLSSFTCAGKGSSPTSSRKIVPALALTKWPSRFRSALVKAPFSCPRRKSTRKGASAPFPGMARGLTLLMSPDTKRARRNTVRKRIFLDIETLPPDESFRENLAGEIYAEQGPGELGPGEAEIDVEVERRFRD